MNKKDKIIICRCEDVTQEEIEEAIDSGLTSIDELKKLKRVTMGPCQGRTCRKLILNLIRKRRGINLEEIPPGRTRAPIKGVSMKEIKNEQED